MSFNFMAVVTICDDFGAKIKVSHCFHYFPNCDGRDWGQEEKGTTEDEMVGWHHKLNGHEFE